MKKLTKILILTLVCIAFLFFKIDAKAQDIYIFTEGTDATYYDQGIVDVNNLGESIFEYTYPPGNPQWNDKIPCSTTAHHGATSLKFNYTSSTNGNWKVSIYKNDWSTVDLSTMDSIGFYIYSENELSNSALPLIGIKASNISGTGDVESKLYSPDAYNPTVTASVWTKIKLPLSVITGDAENSELNFSKVKGIIFNQSESNNTSRQILIDDITAFKFIDVIPPVTVFSATGYDSHAELNWTFPMDGLSYRIYASFNGGQSFSLRAETSDNFYLDFVPTEGKNSTVIYRIVAFAQEKESQANEKSVEIKDFTDDELLNLVQQYAFRYFWEGANQQTGMALERSNGDNNTVASGATGMGLMAMIVAHEREYQPREEIKDRILNILHFLETCDRHHGAWSHWYYADNYHTKPFSTKDNGGDLVETSYVAEGLIALRNYFSGTDDKSTQIRTKAGLLWEGIDWDWYRQNDQNVLYWHWSPNYNFEMNIKINGWNECMATYIMAASSPTHSIPKEVYEQGWAMNGNIANKRTFYNYEINLSPDWGGPLFWLHYSFLGINPHGLKDQYANYWQEHVNTTRIHYAYAVANPLNFINYSDKCWGLTASDDPYGYTAHQPMSNDNGTISPTAALASMPYTPEESLKALKYFYRERGKDLFGQYGPYDAFNDQLAWVKKAYIGIDQGPIVVMIENYRSALIWNNVMKDADVQAGLNKLGIQSDITSIKNNIAYSGELKIYPNPCRNSVSIALTEIKIDKLSELKLYSIDGRLIQVNSIDATATEISINTSELQTGIYFIYLIGNNNYYKAKLAIQK